MPAVPDDDDDDDGGGTIKDAQVGFLSLQSQHIWFSGFAKRTLSLCFNSTSDAILFNRCFFFRWCAPFALSLSGLQFINLICHGMEIEIRKRCNRNNQTKQKDRGFLSIGFYMGGLRGPRCCCCFTHTQSQVGKWNEASARWESQPKSLARSLSLSRRSTMWRDCVCLSDSEKILYIRVWNAKQRIWGGINNLVVVATPLEWKSYLCQSFAMTGETET